MKTAMATLIALVVLLSTGAPVCAEAESANERPFMGVLIDPAPLSGLLSKHLGLAEGQGLRVQNVQKDGPADKAGLERDDLIIGFQGKDVRGYEQFVDAIRDAGSGTEVSMQIIHLGTRKTVKLTLKPYEGEPEWKYPREPEAVQSWRPGRFFRLEPGGEDWKELFKDGIPPDIDTDITRFFNEVQVRTYHHSDGEDYTVTIIEGAPHQEDTTIVVRDGDDEYKVKANEIDKLPKEYREGAEDALENARKAPRPRRFDFNNRRFDIDVLPWRTPPNWRGYFDRVNPRNFDPEPFLDGSKEMLDKVEQQMRDLQKRLQEQEQRYRERFEELEKHLDRSAPKPEEKAPAKPDESAKPTGSKGTTV